jgi:acetyl esterase/lipase
VLEARLSRRRLLAAALAGLVAVLLLASCGGEGEGARTGEGASYTVQRDVDYGGPGLLLDAYLPTDGAANRRAILMFHGGAWRGGNRSSMAPFAIAAAERGMAAFTVGYRLDAPRALPGELTDAQMAVNFVRTHAADFGVDPARIGALGSSAGGHLAALIGTTGQGPLTEGIRVKAVATWSGPMDLVALNTPDPTYPPDCGPPTCLSAQAWQALLVNVIGCSLIQCPGTYVALSPIRRVTPDDSPMLLVNAIDELAVPVEQAVDMRRALRGAGVQYEMFLIPGLLHGDAYANLALDHTLSFFERRL